MEAVAFLLLLLFTLTMQGCLGIVWLGVVGVDWTRTSDIEFQPFENSWVAGPHERQNLTLLRTVTVKPFAGDPMMAQRWTAVFQDITDRRAVGEVEAIKDQVQAGSTTSLIDCVLTGDVAVQEPHSSFAGLKENSSHRLYLRLFTDSGLLLWRTELPYTMVRGAKNLDEAMTTKALLTHVRLHENEIGLAGLGTIQVVSIVKMEVNRCESVCLADSDIENCLATSRSPTLFDEHLKSL